MNEVDTAIYERLAATAGLTSLLTGGSEALFHIQAAEGAVHPYCVWNLQGGGDTNETRHRIKNTLRFIRAYSSESAAQAGSIDAQIDTALHLVPLTISGWTNLWLAREADLETVELDPSGRQIWMQGGLYRLIIEDT